MPNLSIAPRLTIHYLDHNQDGSPVAMLLHGLGATGHSWGYQIPALTNFGMRIIAPDIRGFGQSTYPGRGVSISTLCADMACLLESIQIERAHIIGISMGGTIALQLALDFPHMVDKLVLVSTFSQLYTAHAGLLVYLAFRFILVHTLGIPARARLVASRIFPRHDQAEIRQELIHQICQADPKGYRAAMRALACYNATRRLAEIKSPTLIVSGERDNTIPLKIQRQLARSIPNSRHLIIPDSGHAMIAEHPGIFNRALLDFLSE